MENFQLLIEAMEYIEDNLTEPIKTENIADKLHCSKSTIEKLFRYINNISIRDYIIRRRMSKASREIVSNPEKSLLDIAVEYGYGSNEAFQEHFAACGRYRLRSLERIPLNLSCFPDIELTGSYWRKRRWMTGRRLI